MCGQVENAAGKMALFFHEHIDEIVPKLLVYKKAVYLMFRQKNHHAVGERDGACLMVFTYRMQ